MPELLASQQPITSIDQHIDTQSTTGDNTGVSIDQSGQIMEGMLGEVGMRMLNAQLDVWRELNMEDTLQSPLRDAFEGGDFSLPGGTLFHGVGMHGFSEDALRGIAEKGVVSGELIGITEDAETHGCADFFRVPDDVGMAEYFKSAKEPVIVSRVRRQKGERLLTRGVTFIIDPKAEGMDRLLEHDGYRDPEMDGFIRTPDGRTKEDTAAVLGGVPKGAIVGLVVPDKYIDTDKIDVVFEIFPGTQIFSQSGEQLQPAFGKLT